MTQPPPVIGDSRIGAWFWRHVEASNSGCWLWTGLVNNCGYGWPHLPGKRDRRYAHRITYVIFIGPIADGLVLDHLCRIPSCCNPEHLEPVTCRENIMRSPIAVAAINARKTHEFTAGNTYVGSSGSRRCRACAVARSQAYEKSGRRRRPNQSQKTVRSSADTLDRT